MTLTELQTRLSLYIAAEKAILEGAQSYSISGRSLTRANLSEIRNTIDSLSARIERKEAGSSFIKAPTMVRLT